MKSVPTIIAQQRRLDNQPTIRLQDGTILLRFRAPPTIVNLRNLVADHILSGMTVVEARLLVCELETIAGHVRSALLQPKEK